MILKLIFALGPVGFVLVASEILWRTKIVKGERARKFIHILAGTWMAFWPFYLSFNEIILLSVLALALLVYSRATSLFHAIYAVKRRTYGELFYPLALIGCALLGQEAWVFTVSILLLALADGGAAVVGRFWGVTNQYLVFGKRALRKSWAGTTAYLVLAYAIMIIGWLIGGNDVMGDNLLLVFILLPLGATLFENVSPYGLDNLVTPIYATLLLNSIL